MNQRVAELRKAGRDIIALSLGDTFFDMAWPPFDLGDMDRGSNYSDSRGIEPLRRKLAAHYDSAYGVPVRPEGEILITAGSKIAIFMIMQAIVDAGDEVLIHEPAWVSYQEQVRLLGAQPRFIPYDTRVSDFHQWFTPKTRLLLLNNPNNPAGRIYSSDELLAAYEQCRNIGAYLLVDEAYSDFVSDGAFRSLAALVPDKDGAIVVNSLSKSMGIAGWRIGYVIASDALIDGVLKLNQHLITCAPTVLLQYVAKNFEHLMGRALPQARRLAESRAWVSRYMDQIKLDRLDGDGTFYFFVSIGAFPGSSLDFALSALLEDGISVVPGLAYGESTDRFVRISLGTESDDRLRTALDLLKKRSSLTA